MTVKHMIARVVAHEELNFLLTNRLPRRLATHFIGWLSKIEQPLIARLTIRVWRLFCDVDLSDAAEPSYSSMHACFTRRLVPGARPFDVSPDMVASPSDAIIGACGPIEAGQAYQIKGAPYRIAELFGGAANAAPFEGGTYVTLRLTAGMYHRFHAPQNLTVEAVTYISGDCWNVNSPTLQRIERLFCRNERVAIRCRLDDGTPFVIVAVAAVLVASIRLNFVALERPHVGSTRHISLSVEIPAGEELGWFEQGSTILLFIGTGHRLAFGRALGERVRAGTDLLVRCSS